MEECIGEGGWGGEWCSMTSWFLDHLDVVGRAWSIFVIFHIAASQSYFFFEYHSISTFGADTRNIHMSILYYIKIINLYIILHSKILWLCIVHRLRMVVFDWLFSNPLEFKGNSTLLQVAGSTVSSTWDLGGKLGTLINSYHHCKESFGFIYLPNLPLLDVDSRSSSTVSFLPKNFCVVVVL